MTAIVLAIVTLGFSGIVAQVLLLRELLITFNSNELTIGIILANWLLLESAGSFLAGRAIEKVERQLEAFVGLTVLFTLFCPAAVYFSRTCRDLLGVMPGVAFGLHQVFVASFLILLPVSLSHGALFVTGCGLFSRTTGQRAAGIGKVYLYETLGTVAGGVVFTWLLITRLTSFQIALALSLANFLVCLGLVAMPRKRAGRWEFRGGTWAWVTALGTLLAAGMLFGPGAETLHRLSIERQYPFQEVVHYQNSRYGNVTVTKNAGQYTYFADGMPLLTTPTPHVASAEDFAHFPLLFHPAPERVLVLSGGAGGLLREILKHPVQQVDYAELDPLILETLRLFPDPLTQTELDDPRVRVHHVDGRLLVSRSERFTYDVVLLGLTEPQDLQTNRFFTREFFLLVQGKLRPGGLLALRLPGSLTYLGPELRNLNAVILHTLRGIFPAVRVLPGDGLNLFLASPSQDLLLADPDVLVSRLTERSLPLDFVSPGYIRYRMDPRRSEWLSSFLEQGDAEVNRDFTPLGVYYSLSYWNALVSPLFQKAFGMVGRSDLVGAALIAGLFLFLPAAVYGRARKTIRPGIVLAIATTGMAGMVFDLVLIFAFQVLYGYVFLWVGIFVAAFMAGTALGGLYMVRVIERMKGGISSLLGIEGALAVFAAFLPVAFSAIGASAGPAPGLVQGGFILLAMAGGTLIGLEFPLANKLFLGTTKEVGPTAGLLYGADLLGGWVGGIVGGVMLVPVVGLSKTCLVVAFYKILSLAVLALLPGTSSIPDPAS